MAAWSDERRLLVIWRIMLSAMAGLSRRTLLNTSSEISSTVVSAVVRHSFRQPPEVWAGPVGAWKQVTIFLSPLDVHINRSPVAGRITRVDYRPGRFLPAYDQRSNDNELNEVWVDYHGRPLVFRQVVGILARRIVCRVHEGQTLERGERVGLMRFGSRMDVFMPDDAVLQVRVGDQVVGGETVLATLRQSSAR